jgi:hypothetical protein
VLCNDMRALTLAARAGGGPLLSLGLLDPCLNGICVTQGSGSHALAQGTSAPWVQREDESGCVSQDLTGFHKCCHHPWCLLSPMGFH